MEVALRTEGVDRNSIDNKPKVSQATSPSVRRAWIEIVVSSPAKDGYVVALRTEGVDRNKKLNGFIPKRQGRPPYGGRG